MTIPPAAPTLDAIRGCLDGFIPAVIATHDEAGIPNVSLLSQVHYVDPERVALSYQFFNKTRRNLVSTRLASVLVVDPATVAQYRLELEYQETETSGPLFESMRAKLAGIASHTGMQGVFRLLGADIFRVRHIEPVLGETQAPPAPRRSLLSAVRRLLAELEGCGDLGELCDRTLDGLRRYFGIEHAMVLMLSAAEGRLYTVASRGYPVSGIGSEVMLDEGVVGVAARVGVPIRIGHMSSEYAYGAAIRESAERSGLGWAQATAIPLPGLAAPQSQMALPIPRGGATAGILFVESPEAMRFGYDDEDALAIVAAQVGALLAPVAQEEVPVERAPAPVADRPAPAAARRRATIRHYCADDSVFLNHDYVIKGVAGAILWKLVRDHVQEGRTAFTNRELRLDPALRLPGYAENLEARLVLLHRRLEERCEDIRIERCGRGRFRLRVSCALALEEMDAGPRASAV